MAEDRSLLEKIVKPTDEEVEKLDKIQNIGQKTAKILREEGYINFELRKLSEKALQDGISSKDIKKKLPKVRETLLKEGGVKVRILNFLYPGKGSRFNIDDQKREFEFEKQKDSKDKGKGITEQVGIPSENIVRHH